MTGIPADIKISCFLILFLICACNDNKSRELMVFKALDEELMNSVIRINGQNNSIYITLESRLSEPGIPKPVKVWYDKAIKIRKYSDDLSRYIFDLKKELLTQAGFTSDSTSLLKERDVKAVDQVFETKGKGKELYQKLEKYRLDVLAADPLFSQEFAEIKLFPLSFDTTKNNTQDFTQTYFHQIPLIGAMAMLTRFLNTVKVTESKLITFCIQQVSGESFRYDAYSPIIAQSSGYVKNGDQIEIIAGVGAFSKKSKPEITINGNLISPGADGIVHYQFKAPSQPGKYIVHTSVGYIDEVGIKRQVKKDITYTVLEK